MEEITVLEYEADPQEEHQEVSQQEALGERQAPTFVKGKPQSILSLLCFQTINLSPFMLMH